VGEARKEGREKEKWIGRKENLEENLTFEQNLKGLEKGRKWAGSE